MSKWYEITVTSSTVVVVEVEDEPESGTPEEIAKEYAINQCNAFAGETEVTQFRELKESEVECAKRNADEVSTCDD